MAFLKFPNKDPEERLDYVVDFSDLLVPGRTIASATCEIESATPAESPVALNFTASPTVQLTQLGGESPLVEDGVVLWFDGGTLNTKYQLKVIAIDDAAPITRQYVRRATLQIKEK